ncbi:MAG: RecX family transcriptional regulator [Dehalococcoidales bacterium]
MGRITALRMGRGRKERVNVYVEGKFAFSLAAQIVADEGLGVDRELTQGQMEALSRKDARMRCLSAAVSFLSYRPRSEFEVRERLGRYGFDNKSIEETVDRLKEQGLVSDLEFARFWINDRQLFSPRSKWLIGLELRRKGIDQAVIEQVVGEISDEDNAYRAASTRAHRLRGKEYRIFRHRLASYLGQRGFTYQVINNTVEQLWQEIKD